MYKYENKKINISVKTDYKNRRKNKIFEKENSKKYKNINANEPNINNYKERNKCNKYQKDTWGSIISRTSKEGQNEILLNSKTYRSNIIPIDNYNIYEEKKHFKPSNNYDYFNKTQITTLPGGVKRNCYEINDNYFFKKPYNYSRLFKSVYDYNSNINFEQNYTPITQGHNINSFPTKQRYYGSYRRGVEDHDIFNNKFF